MTDAGFAWQCECGQIEYGEEPPEECQNCYKINSFTKMPEEIINETDEDETDD